MSKEHSLITGYTEKEIAAKRDILSDKQYITWLLGILKKQSIYTESENNYNKELSKEDIANIEKLDSFFAIILEYYQINLIEIEVSEYESTVELFVFFEKTYFKVGLCVGQGAYNYASIVEENTNAVNFEDILNDKESPELAKKQEY